MNYFPIFSCLASKPVAVVGAGRVACRVIKILIKIDAVVTVVAPNACEQVWQWHRDGKILYREQHFTDSDLDGKWLALAATGHQVVNRAVHEAGHQRQVFTQEVEDGHYSGFIPPELFGSDVSKATQSCSQRGGHVSLVGAGPGDPELLTVKAIRRLQQADVVFYDALVSDAVMELVGANTERIFVGKKSGDHSFQQHDITQLLVAAALESKHVVRLKGGDPFVFGRGGEELERLEQYGISFDVVPGITAAAASAAYTGVPLTHRDYAHSAILVTGHGKGEDELDWQALAKTEQTLAIYMGLQKSSEIQQQLIAHGRDIDTPVVVIENATRPEQRCLVGQLNELADLIVEHQVMSPAMILIGEVCRQAGRFHWFGEKPIYTDKCTPEEFSNRVDQFLHDTARA